MHSGPLLLLTAWGVVIHPEINSHQGLFLQKEKRRSKVGRCLHAKVCHYQCLASALAALCTSETCSTESVSAFRISWIPKAIVSFQNKRQVKLISKLQSISLEPKVSSYSPSQSFTSIMQNYYFKNNYVLLMPKHKDRKATPASKNYEYPSF